MKAIKHPETTHTSLHHCLEAYFGTKHRTSVSTRREYREAEQGLCTVPFQSSYPLQLDYMARRSRRWTQIIFK